METAEEEIRLPSDTLKILEEFLKEKQDQETREAELGDDIEKFEENWVSSAIVCRRTTLCRLIFQQLSQFWYDDSTKDTLARVCRRVIEEEGWDLPKVRIGLLSCPSLFAGIKSLGAETFLFEYDKRFSQYGSSFVFYDYTEAFQDGVLDDFRDYFDIIIADPPFLSEECIEKMSRIVAKFAKSTAKVILCSGLVVQGFCKRHMHLDLCKYEPQHQRNLGNQFASYANFDLDKFIS